MTITAAQAAVGGTTDNNLSSTRALGSNVAVGNLVVFTAARFISSSTNAFTAGHVAQSAGTATIGTVTLDRASGENAFDGGNAKIEVGIWSCLVTGAGSLTMTATGGVTGYWHTVVSEFAATSGWGNAAARVEAVNSANETTNSTTAVSSGSATSAAGALFIGQCGFDASGNPFTITEEGTYTLMSESQDASAHMTGSAIRKIVTSGTTDDAQWTCGSTNNGWSAALVIYKEVTPEGGGGGAALSIASIVQNYRNMGIH